MPQRVRELVHRDFEREVAGRFAGRALERRRADVELRPADASSLPFGHAYSMRATARGGLDEVLERRTCARRRRGATQVSVPSRRAPSATCCSVCGRPPTGPNICGRSSDELHRPLHLRARHRGQHDVRPRRALAAEAAADERVEMTRTLSAEMPSVFDDAFPARRTRIASRRRASGGRLPNARWSRAAPSGCGVSIGVV